MTSITKYSPSLLITATFISTFALANEGENASWEGLYGGIAIGAFTGTASPSTKVIYTDYFTSNNNGSDRDLLDPILQRNIDSSDTTGSLLLGYHFQSGKLVYGLEADFTLANYSGSETEGPTAYDSVLAHTTFTTTTKVESDYMVSLRPKIGYGNDTFLVHFSAGPVISEFKTTHNYSDTYEGGSNLYFENTETSIGLSVNIGIDYLLSSNLSLRADYTYYNFSDILDGNGDVNRDGKDDINYGADFTAQNFRLALVKYF